MQQNSKAKWETYCYRKQINVQRKPSVLSGLDANSQLRLLLTAEGRLSIGRADTTAKLVISGSDDPNDYPNIYLKIMLLHILTINQSKHYQLG